MNFHEEKLKEFEEKFSWIHCGNFKPTDGITRTCYKCGFLTEFCDNCNKDHHVERKETAIKSFISQYHRDYNDFLVKKIEEMRKVSTTDKYELNIFAGGFNEALSQIIQLIKSENHE